MPQALISHSLPATLSPEHKRARAQQVVATTTPLPSVAIKKAEMLAAQWPHAKPPNMSAWLAGLAATLAQYPLGVIDECVAPGSGLASEREFPPTQACVKDWCDKRLREHQAFASWVPRLPKPPEREFSDEHCATMRSRLQALMHSLLVPA